jgi:aspartate kinase
MEKQKVVLKFGGSVIPDIQAINRVARTVHDLHFRANYDVVAVVVSAMGKTTNKLEEMARVVRPDPFRNRWDVLRETDALLATGEMQTAALVAEYLTGWCGVCVQSYNAFQAQIYTDDNFGNAKILNIGDAVPNAVSKGIIPVIAGFQGITENGDLTTLGREGSDTTAVEFALKLKADFCWFFKNGGGICDKNPVKYSDAKVLDFITYQKVLNYIDSRDGQVLHKECVKRAKKTELPLFVSGMSPHYQDGTWIGSARWWHNRNKTR